jgi:hypothetical protein
MRRRRNKALFVAEPDGQHRLSSNHARVEREPEKPIPIPLRPAEKVLIN